MSRSSLGRDLGLELVRYAAAGPADYWVVDLDRRRTIVHRDPAPEGHDSITAVPFGEAVTSLALPDTPVVIP